MALLFSVCKIRAARSLIFFAFIVFEFPSKSYAQLCTGNLGDPTLNITFGDGDFPPLPRGATDYTFEGNGCPGPGEYTISSFLFGCGDKTWFPLIGDHARLTSKGCYMLVNGAGKTGTVIKETASGLCANTTYDFSAWITNVME